MENYEHLIETIYELKDTVHEFMSGNDSFRAEIRRELRALEKQLDAQLDNMSKDYLDKIAIALKEQQEAWDSINTRQTAIEKDLSVVKKIVEDMSAKVEQHRRVLYGDQEPGLIESVRIAMRVATEASLSAKESLSISQQTAQASNRMDQHVTRLLEGQRIAQEIRDRRRQEMHALLNKAPMISTALVAIITFFVGIWQRLVYSVDTTSLIILAAFGITIALFIIIVLRIISMNTRG